MKVVARPERQDGYIPIEDPSHFVVDLVAFVGVGDPTSLGEELRGTQIAIPFCGS